MPFDAIPWDKLLEAAGFLIGLLYLWWEYNADARLWIASLVMPFISMWIYFHKGLYADFAINIYYLAIAIYGYAAWTRGHGGKKSEKRARRVAHAPLPVALGCAVAAGLLWCLLWLMLRYLTDSTVPVADAFTTALSIVGMWMLARKYIEQWLVWIAVDAVCVWLYAYKGIPLYAILYAIYTIIAALGYRRWRKMLTAGKAETEG
ncbi:MAG: nicotinamide mononucleotide transporter [Bacteroidales bacterium]|nr:nicotinamide mononucleotide transporter [Bacteroidales bacterium]